MKENGQILEKYPYPATSNRHTNIILLSCSGTCRENYNIIHLESAFKVKDPYPHIFSSWILKNSLAL